MARQRQQVECSDWPVGRTPQMTSAHPSSSHSQPPHFWHFWDSEGPNGHQNGQSPARPGEPHARRGLINPATHPKLLLRCSPNPTQTRRSDKNINNARLTLVALPAVLPSPSTIYPRIWHHSFILASCSRCQQQRPAQRVALESPHSRDRIHINIVTLFLRAPKPCRAQTAGSRGSASPTSSTWPPPSGSRSTSQNASSMSAAHAIDSCPFVPAAVINNC